MEKKLIFQAVGLISAGVAAGSTCTYFGVRKHFKSKYEQLADEEIASVKRSYALLRKEGPYSDPKTAVKAYQERLGELQYAAADATIQAEEAAVEQDIQEHADEEKEVVRNIFDDERTDLLIEAMVDRDDSTVEQMLSMREAVKIDQRDPDAYDDLALRDPAVPFTISREDFFDDSNEFEKLSLHFYEGDNVLTDEQDKVIRNIEDVIGEANLQRFGQDSGDPSIVFVRNERLRADFEVTHDDREYTEVVLGIKADNNSTRRIRRMRDDE